MTARTSIRWYLPGNMSVEYTGDAKPLWRWIAATWRGYIAVWRLWLICAAYILDERRFPWPSNVSNVAHEVISHFVSKARLATEMKASAP